MNTQRELDDFDPNEWGNVQLPGLSDEELHQTNWHRKTIMKELVETRVNNGWYEKNNARNQDPKYLKKLGNAIKNSPAHQAQKEQLDELRRNTPRSKQANEKNSQSRKGKKASVETRKKLQEIAAGRPSGLKKPVMTPKGRFEKLKDAGEAYGVNPVTIRNYMKRDPDNFYFIEDEFVKCLPILTPDGPFRNRNEAGKFYGISGAAVNYRMKAKPDQYYKITQEEYIMLTGKEI